MARKRNDIKELRKAQRETAAQKERAHQRRNLILIGAGFAVAAIAILVIAVALGHAPDTHLAFAPQPAGAVAGEAVPDEGTPHHISPANPVSYKFYPPASGSHFGQPDGPVPWQSHGPLVEGQYLHNLEHGGVAILYKCPAGCSDLKRQLENYVDNLAPYDPAFHEVKIVLTPYSRGMGEHRIALLAWHWIEFLDGYDQGAITRFYEVHVNNGPEKIP
jgi:Protein of unknown function (DUF3105)